MCRRYIYNNVRGREATVVQQLLEMAADAPDGQIQVHLCGGSTVAATPKAMAQECQVDILYLIGTLIHMERLGFVEHKQRWVEAQIGYGSDLISAWHIKMFI